MNAMAASIGHGWAPPQAPPHLINLLAVQVPEKEQKLSESEYLLLLAFRLDDLLRKEPDLELAQRQALEAFEAAGLAEQPVRLDGPLETAVDLVSENPAFHNSLRLRGALEPGGWKLNSGKSLAARLALKRVGLQEWLDLAAPAQSDD